MLEPQLSPGCEVQTESIADIVEPRQTFVRAFCKAKFCPLADFLPDSTTVSTKDAAKGEQRFQGKQQFRCRRFRANPS